MNLTGNLGSNVTGTHSSMFSDGFANSGTVYVNNNGASTSIQIVGSLVGEVATPSGTKIMMKVGKKQIHPRLYFKFVKSKIKESNLSRVKERLVKVQKLLKNFEEMGQEAPFEQLMVEIFKLTKHSEALASGYSKVVEETDITKFMSMVNVDKKVVRFSDFTNFPRPVPKANKSKILEAKKTGIFDNFKILYLDYSEENLKTTKQKIIEKDPIVFGVYKEDPTKHFFITDWVDKVCDLTLLQFVDKMKKKDSEYGFVEEDTLDEEFLNRIRLEYEEKKSRLDNTKPSNFRELAKDEEIARLTKELALRNEVEKSASLAVEEKKKSIFSKFKTWLNSSWTDKYC